MLSTTPPADRLILVENIGSLGDGDSLAGQNVNALPAGCLAYVAASNRFYRLKKHLNSAVVADAGIWRNVVDAVGSSPVNGRWVAVQQVATFTLAGGTVTVSGFDMTTPGNFLISLVLASGTTGFVHGAAISGVAATFTSSQGADTGQYIATFVQDAASF